MKQALRNFISDQRISVQKFLVLSFSNLNIPNIRDNFCTCYGVLIVICHFSKNN